LKKYSLSFLLGNLLLHQMSNIDNLWPSIIIFFTLSLILWLFAVFFLSPKYKLLLLQSGLILLFFQSSFLVSWNSAHSILSRSLPSSLEKQEIVIRGYVDSIPVVGKTNHKFTFLITQGPLSNPNLLAGMRVRLSQYYQAKKSVLLPRVGEFWQFTVKLKQPSGLFNPGGFDYERWLFQQQIRATGYIRHSSSNIKLDDSIPWSYFLDSIRQTFSEKLDEVLENNQFKGLLKALIIGLRDDIKPFTWQVFIDSGTNHLMAISGLHIGLLAAMGFFLGRYMWSTIPGLSNYIPAQQIGAVWAILFALTYAALAGFSIPTQRALIMLTIALAGWFVRRRFPPRLVLSWTLILVLIHDPMCSLSLGFWLSFSAVAVILVFSTEIFKRPQNNKNDQNQTSFWRKVEVRLFQYSALPLVLFLGLLPLSILFFERLSLLSPLANFIAVPWVSLLIIPLSLVAALTMQFNNNWAEVLFNLIEMLVKPLFELLKLIATQEYNLIYLSIPSVYIFIIAVSGVYILLKSRKGIIRILGGFCLFPLFLSSGNSVPTGHFKLSVLDVGQGLSLIVRTRDHLMIYDTGNAISERFNMADAVLLPYLRHYGLTKIDKLVLSHADNDHIGAAPYLLKDYTPAYIVSGEVGRLKTKSNIDADSCIAGQSWQWDGVLFKVISPKNNLSTAVKGKSNNRSCVIWIQAGNGYSALLTGDAETAIEMQLVKNQDIKNSNILVAGHHGSKTSSSQTFVKWINPEIAIFTFGYKNRYNFPAEAVLQRFQNQNTLIYATINGTIDISSNMPNNAAQIREYRKLHQRYWNRSYISFNK